MRKNIFRVLVLAVLLGTPLAFWETKEASAGISFDIHIGPPPAVVFHAPPSVVVIPGSYVYRVPDATVNILFHNGFWYRPHGGGWFRAHSYNGPWVHIESVRIPHALKKIPSKFHRAPAGYHRIPYKKLEKNWSKWERERHWDRNRYSGKRWDGDGRDGRGRFDHDRGRVRHVGHERRH